MEENVSSGVWCNWFSMFVVEECDTTLDEGPEYVVKELSHGYSNSDSV